MGMYYFFSKNGKLQKRGKINLIGRLQLSTEKSREEENEGIIQLRILRVQVTISNTLCICDRALVQCSYRTPNNLGALVLRLARCHSALLYPAYDER